MKYVIFENQKTQVKHVILIADHTTHSTIKIDESHEGHSSPEIKPISAGFWAIKNGQIITFGESASLKLNPQDDDARLIGALLANMGTYAFVTY